jgi:hypothetical protein
MIPRKLTEKIANRLVENVKAYGRQRGWKSTELVKPYARKDEFGIRFDNVEWLIFQNYGTRPHIPWSLEGKIVPTSFGFRKAVGVGTPGFVNIDGVEEWREERWLNPGINATNFVEESAKKAVLLYSNALSTYQSKIRISRKEESI